MRPLISRLITFQDVDQTSKQKEQQNAKVNHITSSCCTIEETQQSIRRAIPLITRESITMNKRRASFSLLVLLMPMAIVWIDTGSALQTPSAIVRISKQQNHMHVAMSQVMSSSSSDDISTETTIQEKKTSHWDNMNPRIKERLIKEGQERAVANKRKRESAQTKKRRKYEFMMKFLIGRFCVY